MELRLSEEEKLVKEAAAQFVRQELLRREGAYLKQREPFLPPGDPPRRGLDDGVKKGLMDKAVKIGLWALGLHEESEKSALSHVARTLIFRELGKTILPFDVPSIPALMVRSGLADRIVGGEITLSLAFHEIHQSGKPDRLRAGFRAAPDGYVLNCAAVDLNCPDSDLFLFPARKEGSDEIGLFLLERALPGLSIRDDADLTTEERVARLSLADCKVPGNRLLGGEKEIIRIVAEEQLRIAARALGIGTRCLESSLEHARSRVTFGRPLSSRQAIQWMVADLSVALRSCTWLTLEAAWKADQGLPYYEAAALAKKRAARMAFDAADTAVQIHGGYGVCKELPFEGFYRAARLMRLLYGQEAEIDGAVGEKFLREGARQSNGSRHR